ncbi:MAG: hypothetical protein ACTHMD_01235 [Flavisolibacter sp.]
MKRNFTNENFEDFLRQSADDLRMRPSKKVWKGVSSHLNQRRRRVGFAIGVFLLAISTFAYLRVENSSSQFAETISADKAKATLKPAEEQSIQNNHQSINQKSATSNFISSNTLKSKVGNSFLSQLSLNSSAENTITDENASLMGTDEFVPTIVDSYFDHPTEEKVNQNLVDNDKAAIYPLSIESVVNSYKPSVQKKKLSFQFYFTPTTSYRKLSENKSFLRSQSPSNPNYAPALIFDVNNVVTHKPDLGFELGMAAKYPITKKMKLTGGLQFNVNRYNIKAYNAVTSVATIMFNARRNNRADSLNTVTSYSNRSGYKTDWLQNYYIQISAPVGVEFKVAGNDKVQFGVGTTIQPTYVLGDRAYLISTDYKSYAEVPQLVRRWNVNTALNTFVGYSTGKLSWQVGPQVRYQLLSSFIDKYPVKENLFDFGLKVGISVNK